MTAIGDLAAQGGSRKPNLLTRWSRRRRATRRQIDRAVWDLRERYSAAAYRIAQTLARQPIGAQRRFWRKVAVKLQRLG